MRNISYSLIPTHLKLCIWFEYNPPINFCYFVSQFELSPFSDMLTMKVNGQWVPCVHTSPTV